MAYENIRKSAKDYSVYFLTIVIGVAVFYMFNSLGDQSLVKSLYGSRKELINFFLGGIELISVLVSFILGFLMVYANSFLIRGRKKEFGTYLLLGMSRAEVAGILFRETFLVGVFSLVAGLSIGAFGSQLMSILVGKLFIVDMSQYRFEFSLRALLATVVNFFVMFGFVFVFNTFSMTRVKLVDLFNASKKNEKKAFRNPWIAAALFVAAILALGICYYRVGIKSDDMYRNDLIRIVLIGTIATFALFWGLGGFLQNVLEHWKGMYLKGLNAFVLKSFCKSINTSSIMLGLICLVLFASLCMFATGFSVNSLLTRDIEKKTPVDFSMECDIMNAVDYYASKGYPVEEWLQDDYVQIIQYECDEVAMIDLFGDAAATMKEQFPLARWNDPQRIIPLSEYNRLMTIYHMDTLDMNPDQYAISANLDITVDMINNGLKSGSSLSLGGRELTPVTDECLPTFLLMEGIETNMGVIIVHDIVFPDIVNLRQTATILAGNYQAEDKESRRAIEDKLTELMEEDLANVSPINPLPPVYLQTKMYVIDQNNTMAMGIIFLIFYMGVIFLMFCAAILALKSLAECVESAPRYEALRKLGVDSRSCSRALFAQIGMFFALPVLPAVLHALVGLNFVKQFLGGISLNPNEMFSGAIGAMIVLLLLYGGYMWVTYTSGKKIVGIE